ncbi:shikimate kinase [Halorubellus sp. JP-L1]|uniref:shikimate kinase n=1 Tax=Halorubellus sp. JP-L1 TaxID=2715753 RepID=UPI0014078553|nr:shikimate kinase [Halorubellus sp. JP-L1]NHN41055.1 shikimate kinase [Halorubellus sp. JP-L1]
MQGRATAPAAGTVLNALATGVGAAFAIDADTTASVALDVHAGDAGATDGDDRISGSVAGAPDADTALVERCVELAVERWGADAGVDPATTGGEVTTESDVPMAAGLKSSSAAANATVLATASALGVDPDPLDACRLGVQAARDAGVTVTGAFDDASASMLGGLTRTDNRRDELLAHDDVEWDVLVWTPPERAYSADADVDRCERVAPMAVLVDELADAGAYGSAMTVNGLAFTAALDFDPSPIVDALPDATGASLSGTGPSYVAVFDPDASDDHATDGADDIDAVAARWRDRDGDCWRTTTRSDGARIL